MEHSDIQNRFGYHAPPDEETVKAYEDLRGIARNFCYDIDERCPECREKSLAITKLEEVIMWANAAIARHGLKRS
jgi:hypothetical protein